MAADSQSIYVLGVCGTGVGALAGLLKEQGHNVRGADEGIYPPMSDKLAQWGIPIDEGYDPKHFASRPDLVVVGNVIRKNNPMATYAREQGYSLMSMPEAVGKFGIADKHSIVIAGTHGKTSVTALCAHLLMSAGKEPGYLVGGALVDYADSFKSGSGHYFVIEGDEYDTAYFDKRPKFVHYKPKTAIITSLEYDHADIYADVEAIENSFELLINAVPDDGHLIVWHGAHRARKLVEKFAGSRRVTIYASRFEQDADAWCSGVRCDAEGTHFAAHVGSQVISDLVLPQWGDLGAMNGLAAVLAAMDADVEEGALRQGLATFGGVKRRMEIYAEPRQITLVDDFGHHPTAIEKTLAAARLRFADRRIWAVFEPRSATSRRNIFQRAFSEALGAADGVIIGYHERLKEIDASERFDPKQVADFVRTQGKPAEAIEDVDAIVSHLKAEAQPNDVVMIFSNGAFDGLHAKLAQGLATND